MDEPLMSQKIRVERKSFYLDLKENASGRFIRITEDVGGRRDTIILPSSGLGDFLNALHMMAQELEALGEVVAPSEPAEEEYTPPEEDVQQPTYYSNPAVKKRGR